MATTITEYIHVADRATELGCLPPTGIAVLPDNFHNAALREDLIYGAEAATIRTLLRNNNLPLDNLLPAGERPPSRHNKSFEWAPLLFISAALLSSDPNAVAAALGVISNYASEFFRGRPKKKVKLDIVVEQKSDRKCKKLSYEGDVDGLKSLPEIVRRVSNE